MKRKITAFTLFAASAVTLVRAQDVPLDLQTAILRYCEAEFKGDASTRIASIFTKKALADEQAQGNEQPGMVDWDTNPIWVVSSFTVGNITSTKPNAARAQICFRVVAKSRGQGMERELVFSPSNEEVLLSFVRIGDDWKVVDPPVAKISRESLIRLYRNEKLARLSNIPGIETENTPRSRFYNRLKAELAILVNIGSR